MITLRPFRHLLVVFTMTGFLSMVCLEARAQAGGGELVELSGAGDSLIAQGEPLADLIERVEPAIVAIHRLPAVRDIGIAGSERSLLFTKEPVLWPAGREVSPQFLPMGLGVVMDAKGLVLTQYLNVRPGDRHRVTTLAGKTYRATLKGADPRSGLAVLEIAAEANATDEWVALPLGDADRLRKGHLVVALGNPHALIETGSPTASWGTITNIAQKASASTNLNNVADELGQGFPTTLHHLGTLLQTDAKLGWAVGGGALIDLQGHLVGITIAASQLPSDESAASYAIPMTKIFHRVVNELKQGKEVEYGLLGVVLSNPQQARFLAKQPAPQAGARVQSVLPGSTAERAGFRSGDLLVDIAGKPVHHADDVYWIVGALPPGKVLLVGVLRNGSRREISLSLSKRYIRGDRVVTKTPSGWRGIETDYATAIEPNQLLAEAHAGRIDSEGCVVVKRVAEKSSAWQAGIRPGMFLSHVGLTRVATPQEFRQAVAVATESVNLRFTVSPSAVSPLNEEEGNNGLEIKVEP